MEMTLLNGIPRSKVPGRTWGSRLKLPEAGLGRVKGWIRLTFLGSAARMITN
jgi:hypothetical protein